MTHPNLAIIRPNMELIVVSNGDQLKVQLNRRKLWLLFVEITKILFDEEFRRDTKP